MLRFPDYAKPFTLYTDASQAGLGAVLMQPDSHGKLGAIAFASRSLNRAESNYSVTQLEVLAIVWALKKFRDLVYGYPITVFTDHLPATYLFKNKQLTGRLARGPSQYKSTVLSLSTSRAAPTWLRTRCLEM